eukprot:TRINITY_DN29574_c0_g1_i1.p1 TRINITY_DN29574_c0_g1~~TRINITY_DN29574_c0_g1_i1.p1  ORF type:complete len:163 (-),score=45.12 TRINITY_DN29574_c0_g1_i1:65-553(-)
MMLAFVHPAACLVLLLVPSLAAGKGGKGNEASNQEHLEVDAEEMKKWIDFNKEELASMIPLWFEHLDADKDGGVSLEEASLAAGQNNQFMETDEDKRTTEAIVRSLFPHADISNNGALEENELFALAYIFDLMEKKGLVSLHQRAGKQEDVAEKSTEDHDEL